MNSIEAVNARSTESGRHTRRSQSETERCPLCGSPITAAIRARLDDKLHAQLAKAEQSLRDQFARERAVAEQTARVALETAKRDAAKAAEQQIKAFRAKQDEIIATRVQAARNASEKMLAANIAAEKSRSSEERIKLTEQLADLKRRIENNTADELGSGAELDLYHALYQEFGGNDKIGRVPRGRNGADIIHDICESGNIIGRIVYDSKAHACWQNRFVGKLRQDMIDHKADHGVLSSTVFPAGTRQLHIQEGVVIAAPGRVVVLAHLLRRQIVQVHMLRLGNEARDEKRDHLYEFLISDRASQLFDRIATLADDMIELDAKESSAHQTTWRRRADLIRTVRRLNAEFTGEVERIIGVNPTSAE